MKRAFSLVELMVVVVIIGILASIAVPTFRVTRERAMDNEASANLQLIMSAERMLFIETGNYYASTAPHEQNINTSLRLSLSTSATQMNWNYITTVGGGSPCCAQATRNGDNGRSFSLRNTEAVAGKLPVSGGCP